MKEHADVVVIGGASAGLTAAVAASQAGAERVVVVEKSPRDQMGGNCRYSLMGFRFVHDGTDELLKMLPEDERVDHERSRVAPYTSDDYLSDLKRVTRGRIDEQLARTLVDDSRDAIQWMTELGHRWRFRNPVDMGDHIHYDPGTAMCPVNGGLGLVERWVEIARDIGVEIRTDSPVSALLGDHRQIRGVRISGPDGEYEIEAGAVILASGGFQASAERRARYLDRNADLMKVRGSRYNTGEVLGMAIALGARPSGQWGGAHASPIDMHTPDMELDDSVNRYAYPFGISVDVHGKRFFDEAEAHRTYTYAKTGWSVLRQEDGIAYQIYDQQAIEYFPVEYQGAIFEQADSIPELATKIGVPSESLTATVEEYNAAIEDNVPFDASSHDGRGTSGIEPPHSNWSQRLTKPPFRAYTVTAGITFTFGGLAVNHSAQVLNSGGDPIAGLYANGDILGLFYHNYPSCTGMTRNAVFGGRAGAAAAGLG